MAKLYQRFCAPSTVKATTDRVSFPRAAVWKWFDAQRWFRLRKPPLSVQVRAVRVGVDGQPTANTNFLSAEKMSRGRLRYGFLYKSGTTDYLTNVSLREENIVALACNMR